MHYWGYGVLMLLIGGCSLPNICTKYNGIAFDETRVYTFLGKTTIEQYPDIGPNGYAPFIFTLSRPTCFVIEGQGQRIEKMQLSGENLVDIHYLNINHEITIQGKPFVAFSGWHVTPIVLDVQSATRRTP